MFIKNFLDPIKLTYKNNFKIQISFPYILSKYINEI